MRREATIKNPMPAASQAGFWPNDSRGLAAGIDRMKKLAARPAELAIAIIRQASFNFVDKNPAVSVPKRIAANVDKFRKAFPSGSSSSVMSSGNTPYLDGLKKVACMDNR